MNEELVRKIREGMLSVAGNLQLNTVTGKDGKQYPAKKPTTKTTTSETTTTTKEVREYPVEESLEERGKLTENWFPS